MIQTLWRTRFLLGVPWLHAHPSYYLPFCTTFWPTPLNLGNISPALHSLIATLLLTAYFLLLLPSGTCWEYQLALPFFCGFHFLLLWFVICSVGVCRFRCSLQWLKDNAVSQVCVQLQIQFSAWIVAAWWGRAGFSFFVSVDDDVWCVISWFCHLQMLLLLLSPWFVLFSQSPCVGLSKPACTDWYYLGLSKIWHRYFHLQLYIRGKSAFKFFFILACVWLCNFSCLVVGKLDTSCNIIFVVGFAGGCRCFDLKMFMLTMLARCH